MGNQTRRARGGSPLGRLLALGAAFAVGYVLGSRSGGNSDAWEETESEPTEITIDDGEGSEASEESESESG